MKNKERKNLANKIAKAEWIIQNSNDPQKVKKAEAEIFNLSSHVDKLEDMTIIDEMVQEILSSKKFDI